MGPMLTLSTFHITDPPSHLRVLTLIHQLWIHHPPEEGIHTLTCPHSSLILKQCNASHVFHRWQASHTHQLKLHCRLRCMCV